MPEYIDREALIHHYENCINEVKNTNGIIDDFEVCLRALQNQPTADVVEIVRCRDCKYFSEELYDGKHGCNNYILPYCKDNDFCSYGERKE